MIQHELADSVQEVGQEDKFKQRFIIQLQAQGTM
jgi:hypothetical protein